MGHPPANITPDGWRRLAKQKRAAALAMVNDRRHCREAWSAAGHAVEFSLKAVIMRRNRFNEWPDARSRPDLNVHNLRSLMELAGIDRTSIPRHLRAKVKTVLDWERAHDYNAGPMSRRQARTMVDAAFGDDGVIAWLATL